MTKRGQPGEGDHFLLPRGYGEARWAFSVRTGNPRYLNLSMQIADVLKQPPALAAGLSMTVVLWATLSMNTSAFSHQLDRSPHAHSNGQHPAFHLQSSTCTDGFALQAETYSKGINLHWDCSNPPPIPAALR